MGLAKNEKLVVTFGGLKLYSIKAIQQIERDLDMALAHAGFSRSGSSKAADKTEITYSRAL